MEKGVLSRAGFVLAMLVALAFALWLFDRPMTPIAPSPPAQAPTEVGDTTSAGEGVAAAAAVIQVLALFGGGAWASYVYLTSRRNRAALGIQAGSRIISMKDGLGRVLLIRLRITNPSNAVYHNHEATATLMAARDWSEEEGPVLVPFGRQDPFRPVYGNTSDSADEIQAGRFLTPAEEPIILEPGEGVETELVFPLGDEDSLLAVLVRIQGWERKPKGQKWVWSSFFYLDGASGTTTALPSGAQAPHYPAVPSGDTMQLG